MFFDSFEPDILAQHALSNTLGMNIKTGASKSVSFWNLQTVAQHLKFMFFCKGNQANKFWNSTMVLVTSSSDIATIIHIVKYALVQMSFDTEQAKRLVMSKGKQTLFWS